MHPIDIQPEQVLAWLETQGPFVGTAREEQPSVARTLLTGGAAMFAYGLKFKQFKDFSPLATFLKSLLPGYTVTCYNHHAKLGQVGHNYLELPEWLWQWDAMLQQVPGRPVSRQEALDALTLLTVPQAQPSSAAASHQ